MSIAMTFPSDQIARHSGFVDIVFPLSNQKIDALERNLSNIGRPGLTSSQYDDFCVVLNALF